jgi:hypothetical protein
MIRARAFRPPPVGDGDLETLALQTNLDGDAYHRVVIDHENARHDQSSFSGCGEATRPAHAAIKAERRRVVCMIECI